MNLMKRHNPPKVINYPWQEPPALGFVIEVADGVLWGRLPLPMKLDHVNVFVLDDGGSWTIVDTGLDSTLTRDVWMTLLEGPLKGKAVTRVVVTHHHPDHIGLAGWFQKEYDVEFVTTRTAWLFARMLTLDEQDTMLDETAAFYVRGGMSAEILEERKCERPFNFADVVAPMPLGFTRIKQGDVFRMGGRDWDVHIGHGHAPEHATFWSRNDNLVLTGDQVLASISPNIGVYATEPMADPVDDWMKTCRQLMTLAKDDHMILAGHKLPFVGLSLRMRQLLDNHSEALLRLREFLTAPKTAAECFFPLFKRTIGKDEYGLALVEAIAHMNHLFLSGHVTRSRRTDGAWLYERVEM